MISTKQLRERHMTVAEKKRKEKYVKGMKKKFGDFEDRYGEDSKSVMYATATKMAMRPRDRHGKVKDDYEYRDLGKKGWRKKKKSDQITEAASKKYKKHPKIPVLVILKRRAMRLYPDGQVVALYHANNIDKYVTIPFTTVGVGNIDVKD